MWFLLVFALGVSVRSAITFAYDARPVEPLVKADATLEGDGMTSMVDSSDFIETGSLSGVSNKGFEVVSGRNVFFRGLGTTATGATADKGYVGSVTGCDGNVLDFGIKAEAKADFSFDLSNIPDAMVGRWTCVGSLAAESRGHTCSDVVMAVEALSLLAVAEVLMESAAELCA